MIRLAEIDFLIGADKAEIWHKVWHGFVEIDPLTLCAKQFDHSKCLVYLLN